MFTRTTGFLIVPCWLAAMSWLVAHDVLPRWVAPAPPSLRREFLQDADARQAEYTITTDAGVIGTLWTSYLVDEGSIRRDDLVWIERLPMDITPLRIVANSVYTADGVLDEFDVRLENPDTIAPLKLHGERFHSDFSFSLENGPMIRTFKIPLTEGGLISGVFNPFAEFRDLQVGRRWQMQVFNPVAALTNIGPRFIPLLVSVTGEERINTGHWEGNCLVVEAGGTKAWVGASGEVRLQEVILPVVGTLRLTREPRFDTDRRNAIRRRQIGQRDRWSD